MSDELQEAAEKYADFERADGAGTSVGAAYRGFLAGASWRESIDCPTDDGDGKEWAKVMLIRVWKAMKPRDEEWAKQLYRELSRVLLGCVVRDAGDELARAMRRVR